VLVAAMYGAGCSCCSLSPSLSPSLVGGASNYRKTLGGCTGRASLGLQRYICVQYNVLQDLKDGTVNVCRRVEYSSKSWLCIPPCQYCRL
jgi:hypothetical protein